MTPGTPERQVKKNGIRSLAISTADTTKTTALAFDYGERRIGVAFANRLTDTATVLKTLQVRDGNPDQAAVLELIREWQPDTLVIGVPYNLDGSETIMSARAEQFGYQLGERYGLPIDKIDERLTSREAETILRDQRRSGERRRRVRKEDIDGLAARLIAESWLRNRVGDRDNDL